MKWEGIKQTDVEANRTDDRNDIEENVRNEITEKGEKMPKSQASCNIGKVPKGG